MGVDVIPQLYRFSCDSCKQTVEQVLSSKPTYWSNLIIERDAYDFQGYAVADATVKRLLCEKCTKVITTAINELISKEI